jgi:hypothetical protein
MIDSQMLELGDSKGIVRPESIAVNDTASRYFPAAVRAVTPVTKIQAVFLTAPN